MISITIAAFAISGLSTDENDLNLHKVCSEVLDFKDREKWHAALSVYRSTYSVKKDDVLVSLLHLRLDDKPWLDSARTKFGMRDEPGKTIYREILTSNDPCIERVEWEKWALSSRYAGDLDFLSKTLVPYWQKKDSIRFSYLLKLGIPGWDNPLPNYKLPFPDGN